MLSEQDFEELKQQIEQSEEYKELQSIRAYVNNLKEELQFKQREEVEEERVTQSKKLIKELFKLLQKQQQQIDKELVQQQMQQSQDNEQEFHKSKAKDIYQQFLDNQDLALQVFVKKSEVLTGHQELKDILNTELNETLRNTSEIQLTKNRIDKAIENQVKVNDNLRDAYKYKSQARMSFLGGMLQTTGSVVGNLLFPIFGGLFGYGVSAAAANQVENFATQKVDQNLEKLK